MLFSGNYYWVFRKRFFLLKYQYPARKFSSWWYWNFGSLRKKYIQTRYDFSHQRRLIYEHKFIRFLFQFLVNRHDFIYVTINLIDFPLIFTDWTVLNAIAKLPLLSIFKMIFIFSSRLFACLPYFTTIYGIKLYWTWLNIRYYCSILCDTIILHYTIQCYIAIYYTTLHYTILHYTTSYHIIAHYSISYYSQQMLSQDSLKSPF